MKSIKLNFKCDRDYEDFVECIREDANQLEGITIDESKEEIEVTFDEIQDNLTVDEMVELSNLDPSVKN